jgi:hypothetical protein
MRGTPGLTSFLPQGPGIAVEIGYRHPVALRACPVFDANGLVLVRGRGDEAWVLEKTPQMGDIRAFARVELRSSGKDAAVAVGSTEPELVRVPLRVMPSPAPWKNVTATWIPTAQLPLLRRLAYALPPQTIQRTTIAVTPRGAFLRSDVGIEAIPLGVFFVELHPNLFIPAGYDVTPAIAPEVLYRALGAPAAQVMFITAEAKAVAVEESAFAPFENALLEAQPWEPIVAESIESALSEAPIDLKLQPLGVFPLRSADPPLAAQAQAGQGAPGGARTHAGTAASGAAPAPPQEKA